MIIEVGQKIISNIIRIRLAPLVEELDHEPQCGFRPKRGTGDAIFNLKMALKKTKEHNLESWVLFIDFVKEFDQFPKETLWKLKKNRHPSKIYSTHHCRTLHHCTTLKRWRRIWDWINNWGKTRWFFRPNSFYYIHGCSHKYTETKRGYLTLPL